MYTAYYDASGTESDKTLGPLTVAGVLARESRWRRFEREWDAVLQAPEFNVPYLHMREFAHSAKGSPFESWKGQEEKRRTFLEALRDVLKRNVNKVWIMYVPLSAFERVNERFRLKEVIGGAYSFGALTCRGKLSDWMREHHPTAPLEHVFEAGDDGQKMFAALCRITGREPIIRQKMNADSGKWIKPFQAADYLAYEWALALHREDASDPRPPRGSVIELFRHIPNQINEHNEASLTTLCETYPDLLLRR